MSLLDAINAAAASLQSEQKSEPKGAPKSAPKAAQPKASAKAAPKSEKKSENNFLNLFNDYLRGCIKQALDERAKVDPVLAEKMLAKDKSFDDCLNYIGQRYYQMALKQRNGRSCVSFGGDGQELVAMAVHYYDESAESLKAELKVEELKK